MTEETKNNTELAALAIATGFGVYVAIRKLTNKLRQEDPSVTRLRMLDELKKWHNENMSNEEQFTKELEAEYHERLTYIMNYGRK